LPAENGYNMSTTTFMLGMPNCRINSSTERLTYFVASRSLGQFWAMVVWSNTIRLIRICAAFHVFTFCKLALCLDLFCSYAQLCYFDITNHLYLCQITCCIVSSLRTPNNAQNFTKSTNFLIYQKSTRVAL
jgi:hypothetical protein